MAAFKEFGLTNERTFFGVTNRQEKFVMKLKKLYESAQKGE